MAGVKYCDIIQLNATYAYPTWILNNIIVPLDEYIDYESPIIRANSYMYYSSAWGGRHWGITCIYEHAFANIMYNRALLGREGITDIIDLVEADRWTWNEFVDIAVRCTRDLNGDGITDQWGIVERNRASFCNQILYSNGVYPLKFDSNGNPSYNLSNASAARALQLISDLSFVYRVCKDDNIKSVPTYTGGFGAMYVDQYWYNPNMLKAGVDSAIAPLPMGPDVDHYQNTEKPTDLFAILSTCEKPKEICRIFAECMIIWDESLNPADDYNEFLQLKGGVSWLWNPANLSRRMSTEREYEQVFKRLLPYFRPDMTQGYSGVASKVDSEIYKNIINSSKSVADAVESLRPVIDSILDSYK